MYKVVVVDMNNQA